ncbi:MAG: hypothetical protein QG572_980 [Pseudomonadota bacterium]|nr:hypothetical protein [Pseudomonadota bacterium]
MSLINQMLKDLDARHEVDSRGRLHREIRALPAEAGNRGLRLAIVVLLLLALVAGSWWVFERSSAFSGARMAASAPPGGEPAAVPGSVPVSVASSAATSAPLPPVAESSPVPATIVPSDSVALDDASGLKLSAMLDKPPVDKPLSQPATRPSSLAVPGEAVVPPKAARSEVPQKGAGGVVEKQASGGKTPRDRAEADYRKAVSLVNSARISEATDLLLDALRQDGGHVPSRQMLARLLIEQRRYDEAMAILFEGLASLPGQVSWAMMLARLQVERGDLAGAAKTLQTSLPYATANADYLGFSGLVQHRLGHQKASAELYQAAASTSPSEGRWWLGLGLALEADQRTAEAREAFLRARATGTLNADLAALVDQKLR